MGNPLEYWLPPIRSRGGSRGGVLGSRLIVAAWGIPLLLGLTWLGGWWTAALVAGIAAIAQYEYYRLMELQGRRPLVEVGLATGVVVVGLWQVAGMEALGWSLAALFLLLALAALMSGRTHADLLATFGGVCYPPLLGGSFLLLRGLVGDGRMLAVGLWGVIWVCDTAAYAGGRMMGRHPLAPEISPKKSIEGFVWGLIGAILFAAIWWWAGFIPLDLAIALAFAAGLIGQLGDLMESSLKREAGVKDAGAFLPGHGGALDRFDSLFAAAPVVAMFLIVRDYWPRG